MMWKIYPKYSSFLDIIAGAWTTKVAGRFSFDELRSECLNCYINVFDKFEVLKEDSFSKYLSVSCSHAILSLLHKKKIHLELDKVTLRGSRREFIDLMHSFCLEYARDRLDPDELTLLLFILQQPDVLDKVHAQRTASSPYTTKVSRQDLSLYCQQHLGWDYGRFTRAFLSLRVFILEVYFPEVGLAEVA